MSLWLYAAIWTWYIPTFGTTTGWIPRPWYPKKGSCRPCATTDGLSGVTQHTSATPARTPARTKRAAKPSAVGAGGDADGGAPEGAPGLRISYAAARAGVSTRTLRYYEELGLLTPSDYTAGGERRYCQSDMARLDRILELRDVLGMSLEEIKGFIESDTRLDKVREAYRAKKGVRTQAARAQQKALLEEALALNQSLAEQVATKLARMDAFRARLADSAQRCRELLDEL